MKHRKLFPDDSTTVTIQPPDCIYCLPGCPPNICTPVVIDLPSPPPPPPPPPPSHHHVSPYVIIFVCSVLGCFFFILLNVIRSKVRELNQASMNNRPPQSLSDGSEDENRVDHPIWLISTVGLQQSIINSIAVCKYKKGEGLVEGTECSVCLNEFQEDETLRLLPKCNHAFHVSCIDTWLKSHTNCPLCRASIISSTVPAPLPNQNPASSTGIANPQIDNSGSNRQLGENQERNGQNRTRTEGGEVLQAGVERILKPSVNFNENGVLQVLDDSDDDIQVLEDDSQPLRRSVSFDSSMTLGLDDFGLVETGNISVDQVNDAENLHSTIDNKQDGENPSTSRQTGSCSSIVQCLHKSPVTMRTILSPRRNNNLKTVLPL